MSFESMIRQDSNESFENNRDNRDTEYILSPTCLQTSLSLFLNINLISYIQRIIGMLHQHASKETILHLIA